MSMTIFYELGENLYVNLTNRCSCRCIFCLRQNADHVQDTDSLWLEHEPTVEETLKAAERWDLSRYPEVVFCGYGEPTERLPDLLAVAKALKQRAPGLRVRINTNGLSDLRYGADTARQMAGVIDRVSISLNASNEAEYLRLTRSSFGAGSFEALLRFARRCREYGIEVRFTVVSLLPEAELEECRRLSRETGVPLVVRPYEPRED